MQKRGKTPKVSVLVPIYNVEKYLRECLESLAGQTLQDIEIICINDGSTDGSPVIIKEYVGKDSRFSVITKKNTGYGDSMNKGIEKARGEYIGIVESDDWVEPSMFEDMYEAARENGSPDIVKSNFWRYRTNPTRNEKYTIVSDDEDGRVIDLHEYGHIFTQMPSIWSAIYRRAFLNENKIRFLPSPGASYQDVGFTVKTFTSAERVLLLSRAYLHYRVDNDGSSINNVDKKMHATIDEYKEVDRYLEERPELKKYYPMVNYLRFGNHYWTFENLSPKFAKQYVRELSEELRKIKDLDFSVFDEKRAKILQKILDDPDKYYARRHLHTAKWKLKRAARKAAHAISPTYRSLEKVNDELRAIKERNAQLLKKLENLEKKK